MLLMLKNAAHASSHSFETIFEQWTKGWSHLNDLIRGEPIAANLHVRENG